MNDDGDPVLGEEGVLQYIKTVAQDQQQQPFFLILSLVNPHDVLFYPSQFDASGYSYDMLEGEIEVPLSVNESLITKPIVQGRYKALTAITTPSGPQQQRNYV